MRGKSGNPGFHHGAYFLLIAATAVSGAQELPREPRLVVRSDMVLVPAVVTDRNHRLVRDLTANNFELKVDRARMPVAGFWREQEPVSTIIVFDASGSMKPVLAHSKEAIDAFMDLARPGDEYGLVVCREQPSVAVPLTGDSSRISAASALTAAKGGTPLFDSISVALNLVRKGRHQRKVILVVSDGADTASRLSFGNLRSQVLETQASIYAVQFWTGQGEDEVVYRQLADLANLTGGIHLENVSDKQLTELFTRLDVHERYVLAFQPHEQVHDGKWHTIGVRLRDTDISRPHLYWRHGYADLSSETVR